MSTLVIQDDPVTGLPQARGASSDLRREPDGRVSSGWCWDGEALRVHQSRHGMHPLFVWSSGRGIGVSRSVQGLLQAGAPPTLDDAAVALFLRLGFFVGEDTPFAAIRAVPADSELHWEPGAGLRVVRTPRPPPRASGLTRDEAIAAHIELTRAAVRRCLPPPGYAMPLSGGCDSRHLLLELIEAGRPPSVCITAEMLPDRTNEDVPVAAALCRELKLPHRIVPQSWSWTRNVRDKNTRTSLCCDEHTWALPLVRTLQRSTSVLVDGIAGDVLSTCFYITPQTLQLCHEGQLRALADWMLGDSEVSLAAMLTPQAGRRFSRDAAAWRLARALAPHLRMPNSLSSFSFANRTRREIALYTYGLFDPPMPVIAPYLDDPLVDLLLSLPQGHFVGGEFHKQAIRLAFPRLAHLPFAGSGAAGRSGRGAPPAWWRLAFNARRALDLGRRLAAAPRGVRLLRHGFLASRLPLLLLRGGTRFWFDLELLAWGLELEQTAGTA